MIPPPPIALRSSRERRAFTLIELLTVIAIIGILVAILFPVRVRVRAAADSAQCLSQLAQIGTAIGGYTNDHDGTLPGPRIATRMPIIAITVSNSIRVNARRSRDDRRAM